MVGTGVKILLLGGLALLGIVLIIPSGLTSLVLTGIAVVGIAVTLIGAMLK